jgi:hypothetical protein
MIWVLMMYCQSQLRDSAGNSRGLSPQESNHSPHIPFHFSNTQQNALETLYNLMARKERSGPRKAALYNVFFSLYMEDQPLSQALQTFSSPVADYFALKCWDDLNRAFINVRDIPVALAKLQYSIRLCCFHKILFSIEDKKIAQVWIE